MSMTRTLCFCAAMALATSAGAQTRWEMPTPYSDGEFHTRNAVLFAETVKKSTGGQLDITIHANQSLIKHADVLRSVSGGQVNIAEFLLGQYGNEEAVFNADNVPFLAAGYDNAWKLYAAQKPTLEKRLQSRNLKLLYSVAWPGQGIYTRAPMKGIADLKGQRVRVYSPLTERLFELIGARPAQIQASDVPQAFATGTISGMITSSATGTASKAWEFVKNYYMTNAMHPKNVVVVNQRSFDRLPNAQKKALLDAASTAETRGWAMSKVRELEANELLAKNGMTVHKPDAAMMKDFARIGAQMKDEWLKAAGADGAAIMKAYTRK